MRFGLRREYGTLSVRGEVFSVSRAPSGHTYLTLKEGDETLNVAFFKNRNFGDQTFKRGDMVACSGALDVYNSGLQLIATAIEPIGDGALYEEFLQLKAELANIGYFDTLKKKTIPPFVESIALITSESGAALQDILSTASDVLHVLTCTIYHTSVQGSGAAMEIARAISSASRSGVQVIAVSRGGGSLSDLHPFNSRIVAEAIFRSSVPVISAVGHETDVTIADLVADQRLETPTALGHFLATPYRRAREQLQQGRQRLERAIQSKVAHGTQLIQRREEVLRHRLEQRLANATLRASQCGRRIESIAMHQSRQREQHLAHLRSRILPLDPESTIDRYVFRIEGIAARLERAALWQWQQRASRLERLRTTITHLSPQRTLERGYAVLRTPDHKIVRSVQQATPGQDLEVLFADGTVSITIKQNNNEVRHEQNSHDKKRSRKTQK